LFCFLKFFIWDVLSLGLVKLCCRWREREENEGIMKRKMSDQFFSVLSSEITKRTATERKKERNKPKQFDIVFLAFYYLKFFSLLVG